MERHRKIELVQRSLGLRHKLRVHESMKAPDTHEDLALMLLAKWELEDELHAIEEILSEIRLKSVESKKLAMQRCESPGLIREAKKNPRLATS